MTVSNPLSLITREPLKYPKRLSVSFPSRILDATKHWLGGFLLSNRSGQTQRSCRLKPQFIHLGRSLLTTCLRAIGIPCLTRCSRLSFFGWLKKRQTHNLSTRTWGPNITQSKQTRVDLETTSRVMLKILSGFCLDSSHNCIPLSHMCLTRGFSHTEIHGSNTRSFPFDITLKNSPRVG